MFAADSALCYSGVAPGDIPAFSACASNEPGQSAWPLADGVISLVPAGRGGKQANVALEYKRQSEGVHGLLTAIGQTLAYIHKGYNGAVMVIPREYSTLQNPADHVMSVLDTNDVGPSVGVFDYEMPDKTSAYPFENRLRCVRPLAVGKSKPGTTSPVGKPRTQWAHLREGSTTRDALCGYLQSAIRLSTTGAPDNKYGIPGKLAKAVKRLQPGTDPAKYLSYTSDDRLGSRIWRDFWFSRVATKDVLTPFVRDAKGQYSTPAAETRVRRDDDAGWSLIFEGRRNGLKETIVAELNAGNLSEDEAWEAMAVGFEMVGRQNKQGVRERAHSYREDVDSSLAQLHWIDAQDRPTDQGYRFVGLCERYGGPNSVAAKEYFGATLIQVGRFGSFLHYVHRLSEEMFGADPLAFTRKAGGTPTFNEDSYWEYLGRVQRHLVEDLKVMNTGPKRRTKRKRTLFQAELTFLRKYGFIPKEVNRRYRLGVGLPINWVKVHEAMELQL